MGCGGIVVVEKRGQLIAAMLLKLLALRTADRPIYGTIYMARRSLSTTNYDDRDDCRVSRFVVASKTALQFAVDRWRA